MFKNSGLLQTPKSTPAFFLRTPPDRNHDRAHRAWQDYATNDDYVAAIFVLEYFADLFANSSDMSQVEIAAGLAWSSNATNESSVSRIAWVGSLVARSRPALAFSAMISPTSVSTEIARG